MNYIMQNSIVNHFALVLFNKVIIVNLSILTDNLHIPDCIKLFVDIFSVSYYSISISLKVLYNLY